MKMRALVGVLVVLGLVLSMAAFSFAQDGPAPAPTVAPTGTTVPVEWLDNPGQLASLAVVDPTGAAVGKVVNVKTGSDGKATRLLVALSTGSGAGRVAAMRAERLVLNKAENVIVAQFTPSELSQLAETSSASAGGIDTSQSSGMVQRRLPSSGDAAPPMGY